MDLPQNRRPKQLSVTPSALSKIPRETPSQGQGEAGCEPPTPFPSGLHPAVGHPQGEEPCTPPAAPRLGPPPSERGLEERVTPRTPPETPSRGLREGCCGGFGEPESGGDTPQRGSPPAFHPLGGPGSALHPPWGGQLTWGRGAERRGPDPPGRCPVPSPLLLYMHRRAP